MLIDKPTKIKIVKEHLNDGITLKELKEKYGKEIKIKRQTMCIQQIIFTYIKKQV